MEGYAEVAIDDFKIVVNYYDDFYDEYVRIIRSVKDAAYKHRIDKTIGQRTFWHWLYLVPWSYSFAYDQAIEDMNSSWYGGCRYHAEELELTDSQCNTLITIQAIIEYLRSNIDHATSVVGRADKDTVLLNMDSVHAMHRFIKNIKKLNLQDFPTFEQK